MAGLDMTSFDAALKSYYTDERIENMVYPDNAFFALVDKDEKFEGKNMPLPILYGNPQGRSATFATAQTASTGTSTKLKAFTLTRVKDYGVAVIDNETMKASQSNEGAFMEAATVEIDGIIQSLTRSNAGKIYRAGWGDIGVIAVGGISGSTITLATIDDVVGWESDMKIQLCADQSGSVYRAGGPLTVSAVNRLTGVVTFTAGVVATIGAAVVGDFTFIDGDRQNSATPVRLCLSGLEAWIPSAAPTATVFFGADRSVDPTRLGGLRYNGANIPIEETLVEAATLVGREGHKLTHFFMSFKSFSALQKTLGSKVQYVDLKITPEIGFTAIKVTGPRGPINVVPDQNCPANRVFGLNMDYIKLYSLGKPIGVIDSDGMTILRQGTADGVEARYGMYAQLGIRAPGAQINVQV